MNVHDELLRVPEVARRLGVDGVEAYALIGCGELAAGKGNDGLVYVRVSEFDECQQRAVKATS